MTTWLTVKEAQERFKAGRERVKLEARLAGALHESPGGGRYRIDAEALDEYIKTKQRAF